MQNLTQSLLTSSQTKSVLTKSTLIANSSRRCGHSKCVLQVEVKICYIITHPASCRPQEWRHGQSSTTIFPYSPDMVCECRYFTSSETPHHAGPVTGLMSVIPESIWPENPTLEANRDYTRENQPRAFPRGQFGVKTRAPVFI